MSCFVHRVRPAPNEEVFVTFVKSLGVNELGVSRGYDMVSFFLILVWAISMMLSFYAGILWREFGGFGWDVQPTGGRPKRRDQSVTYTRGGQCKGVTSREEDAARGREGGHRRQGEQQDAGSGRGQG